MTLGKSKTVLTYVQQQFKGLHYAAYIKDELDKGPFDYTFSRNDKYPEEFYMRNATLLPGLELGIEKLKRQAQVNLLGYEYELIFSSGNYSLHI